MRLQLRDTKGLHPEGGVGGKDRGVDWSGIIVPPYLKSKLAMMQVQPWKSRLSAPRQQSYVSGQYWCNYLFTALFSTNISEKAASPEHAHCCHSCAPRIVLLCARSCTDVKWGPLSSRRWKKQDVPGEQSGAAVFVHLPNIKRHWLFTRRRCK